MALWHYGIMALWHFIYYKDKTVWCTQKTMGILFDCDRSVVTKHLGNIFESGELEENQVCAKIAHTAWTSWLFGYKYAQYAYLLRRMEAA